MAKPPRSRPDAQSPLSRPTLTPQVQPLIVGDATDSGTPAATAHRTPAVPEQQTTGVTESGTPEPRYLTLVRKEARIRADQADALVALRRRLSRARKTRTEPLTDNTLIRVAIDLLLQHADQLHGDTEDELRQSVAHGLTD